jgi:hypothetical protein
MYGCVRCMSVWNGYLIRHASDHGRAYTHRRQVLDLALALKWNEQLGFSATAFAAIDSAIYFLAWQLKNLPIYTLAAKVCTPVRHISLGWHPSHCLCEPAPLTPPTQHARLTVACIASAIVRAWRRPSRPGESKRLLVESHWSSWSAECQRFWHPPRLNKWPF